MRLVCRADRALHLDGADALSRGTEGPPVARGLVMQLLQMLHPAQALAKRSHSVSPPFLSRSLPYWFTFTRIASCIALTWLAQLVSLQSLFNKRALLFYSY